MSGSIRISDTTRPDGFAEVGSVVSIEQANPMARASNEVCVSNIKTGCPARPEAPGNVAKAVPVSEAVAVASCDATEVAAAIEAVRNAKNPVVQVYVSAREAVEAAARTHVSRAIRHAVAMVRAAGIPVEFSIAHIEEMERPFRRQCIDVAVHAGATRIGVPNSTGKMDDAEYAALVRDIAAFAGPRVVVAAYRHNASERASEDDSPCPASTSASPVVPQEWRCLVEVSAL